MPPSALRPPPAVRRSTFDVPSFLRLLPLFAVCSLSAAGVVLNEVMYHPPEDHDELQFIELHNPGSAPADLAGWSFAKGVKLTFPAGTKLAPGGFGVVCRDRAALTAHYGATVPVLGEFTGKLKHGGERIELADAKGTVVDGVKFTDDAPWPASADGESASLERICPTAPGDTPDNWAASKLPATKQAAGTPGRTNDSFAANLPPTFHDVTFAPPVPGKPMDITATIADADGVASVVVLYQVIERRADVPEQTLPMTRARGDAKSGTYRATLPAQPAGRLVRFRIQATDATGSARPRPRSCARPSPVSSGPRPTKARLLSAKC